MLIETANRLKSSVRSVDMVFRHGGDEFIALINNIYSKFDVHNIVANIINSFKPPVIIQGQSINIIISIGVVISPDDSTDCNEILKFSDIAMYEAKLDKDTSFKFFDRTMLQRANDT